MPAFHITAASTAASLPYVTAGAAALALLLVAKSVMVPGPSPPSARAKHVLLSPRTTLLPKLSSDEAAALPYPPDVLPGARDVETPYGSLRVYEWGPIEGDKVLLVHGISTPCVALAPLAEELVKRGRRVMLFDLFGRGYSDAPADLPYDARLYTTQILLALASSPLPWTGGARNAFTIAGYSLGGGIAADFTSHFPHLIASLVLIAPGGLIRPAHISWKSKLLYNTPLPSPLIHRLVGRRLYTPPTTAPPPSTPRPASATDAAQAEAGPPVRTRRSNSTLSHPALLVPPRPAITAAAAVNWQLAAHPGFVPAFVSSIRHAPVYAQHVRWRVVGERLAQERAAAEAKGEVARKKVLLVLGQADPIVIADEVRVDAEGVLGGEANLETVVLEAGHEVPMSRAREVAEAMVGF